MWATVNFVSGSGKMNTLNLSCASSCTKYQQQVEQENSMWDWKHLTVNKDELEMGARLGVGSYATVILVRWRDTPYAMKEFKTQAWTIRRRGFPYAVRREVSILVQLANLGHPHVCRLTGIVIEPKIALLFEFCEGGTLFACMNQSLEPFSWAQRMTTLMQIGGALVHLHENRVMHRDLKDNNVLFLSIVTPTSEPHVKVTDVGLARWVGEEEEKSEDLVKAKMTPLEGGVSWHAPEMASGFYDLSVDIFAFGILFLEVMVWADELPEDWREMMAAMQKPQPPLLVTDVITRCLSLPGDRPIAEELLDALGKVNASDAEEFGRMWESPTLLTPGNE